MMNLPFGSFFSKKRCHPGFMEKQYTIMQRGIIKTLDPPGLVPLGSLFFVFF